MCKCGSLEGVFSWCICCHLHHEKQETSGSFLWVKHWVKHGKASLSHQLFFMGWIPINANWKLLIALAKTTLQKSPYFLWDMTYSPASRSMMKHVMFSWFSATNMIDFSEPPRILSTVSLAPWLLWEIPWKPWRFATGKMRFFFAASRMKGRFLYTLW